MNIEKDSYSFKQTHSGQSPFPGGEWGESSEFSHENESLSELNRSRFADTLLTSDEKLREAILATLTAGLDVDAQGVLIDVRNGLVILTGVVRSTLIRDELLRIVEGVSGVKAVQNDIKLGGNL